MKRFNYLIPALLLLISCGRNVDNPYCENHSVIDGPEAPVEINSELIIAGDTLPEVSGIGVVGNSVLLKVSDNDAMFRAYTPEGEPSGAFGKMGRALNEFYGGAMIIKQYDDRFAYINDVNKNSVSVVDLDLSIDSGVCVLQKSVATFPRVLNVFLVKDSMLIYEQETFDTYRLCSKSINSPELISEDFLYAPTDDAFSKYYSSMAYEKNRNKLVSAMKTMNQINFYDLDTRERYSVSVNPSDESIDSSEKFRYYCDLAVSEDYIYALYMNQSKSDSFNMPKPMDIHVFDWDGNLVKTLRTKEYITRLSVDKDNKLLFGLDLEGNVLKYKL